MENVKQQFMSIEHTTKMTLRLITCNNESFIIVIDILGKFPTKQIIIMSCNTT